MASPFEQELLKALPALRRYAVSRCADLTLAEDLVQQTAVQALTYEKQFELSTDLQAWLFTILKNILYSRHRKITAREVEDPDGEIAGRLVFEESPLRKMEAREVLQFVQTMPFKYRQILLMLADGVTYEEAAVELVEHVGTVKSRANRGRQMLKEAGW